MSGLPVVKKFQVIEKKLFFKKISCTLFIKIRFSKRRAEFFEKEIGVEIFNFCGFHSSKILFFASKLLIKHEPEKT